MPGQGDSLAWVPENAVVIGDPRLTTDRCWWEVEDFTANRASLQAPKRKGGRVPDDDGARAAAKVLSHFTPTGSDQRRNAVGSR
jgi:hypothetical protein